MSAERVFRLGAAVIAGTILGSLVPLSAAAVRQGAPNTPVVLKPQSPKKSGDDEAKSP
jgi:hypothetical protein